MFEVVLQSNLALFNKLKKAVTVQKSGLLERQKTMVFIKFDYAIVTITYVAKKVQHKNSVSKRFRNLTAAISITMHTQYEC